MDIFGVNETEPIRDERTECHIRPDVGWDDTCSKKQWNNNHCKCIRWRAIVSIEELRIRELVMRLVRISI